MSDYQAITISPLTPHMGAEIGGIDLSRPLGADVAAELRTALADACDLLLSAAHGG